MNIIGCDLHPRYQVVAWVDEGTGEIRTRRLEHAKGEVQAFYASLPRGATIGIEATFPALWFERLLGECGHELWVGDAACIRASEFASRRPTRGMRSTCWTCCARIGFRASGCRRWRSAICGSCWCIG